MSALSDPHELSVSVPRPHCHQIMGIVGAVSWSRAIRNGTFQYYCLFLIEVVGTENISLPKPVCCALCLVDCSRHVKQLFAIHPSAHVFSSVRVNNSDLIFITQIVSHLFSP